MWWCLTLTKSTSFSTYGSCSKHVIKMNAEEWWSPENATPSTSFIVRVFIVRVFIGCLLVISRVVCSNILAFAATNDPIDDSLPRVLVEGQHLVLVLAFLDVRPTLLLFLLLFVVPLFCQTCFPLVWWYPVWHVLYLNNCSILLRLGLSSTVPLTLRESPLFCGVFGASKEQQRKGTAPWQPGMIFAAVHSKRRSHCNPTIAVE